MDTARPAAEPRTDTHGPGRPPAPILTPYKVYAEGYKVNPPSWSRWVGWLEKDQETPAQPPKQKRGPRVRLKPVARHLRRDTISPPRASNDSVAGSGTSLMK